ncbi:NAD(+) synthase [Terrilactibacillus sp. BCM23-1]|uniref:NH(3)-dependent NAD(+) synthetase n=1 Tax=Terrilactibacillus tamarindi TaxID=2599694 RepID=A0A6N8CTV3_9BACI|nr:NAD(+) synthase [Terrilactibacillus tamarindi]MTT32425.1 NAD(+) synthase [Terrilactibacillus tamarindi]
MEKAIDNTISWLREKANEAHVDGLLVGVSGGIDSATVTHLIKRAFPENSLGVIMPCKSNPQDKKDAKAVIDSAGIDFIEVDLTETHQVLFNQVKKQFGENWDETRAKLGDGNLRARLRMSTLYTVASQKNYLVVGTDNADEWYTGYFTKFGDGGVDLVPLVNFTKGQVGQMAKELGVPESILNKKPSAGLWEGQTDENEMGTTYNMIDAYLEGKEIPEKDKKIIEEMHARTEHKRSLAAAPPKF